MLAVSVKLNGIVISLLVSILHSSLKTACQSQIYRKVNQIKAQLTANTNCPVCGAVVYHHIINLRTAHGQFFHYHLNI